MHRLGWVLLGSPDPLTALGDLWSTLRSLMLGCTGITVALSLVGLLSMVARRAVGPDADSVALDDEGAPSERDLVDQESAGLRLFDGVGLDDPFGCDED